TARQLPWAFVQHIKLVEVRKQIEVLASAEKFFESQVLFSLFDLGIFRELARGPRTADELAGSITGHAEEAPERRTALVAVLDAARSRGPDRRVSPHRRAARHARSRRPRCLRRSDVPARTHVRRDPDLEHAAPHRYGSLARAARTLLPVARAGGPHDRAGAVPQ